MEKPRERPLSGVFAFLYIFLYCLVGLFFLLPDQAVLPIPLSSYLNFPAKHGYTFASNKNLTTMKTTLIFGSLMALATTALHAQNTSYNAAGPPFIGGGQNTAFGFNVLGINGGNNNAGSGFQSLFNNQTGSQNTAHGWLSMNNNDKGSFNTGIGGGALTTNLQGDYNSSLGFNSDVGGPGLNNATAIGANAMVNSSNAIQLGDGNVTDIFMGVGTMATVFTGGLQVSGGSPATGKVLTSDAFGNATWQSPGSAGDWSLLGNAGTTSSNFLGTTDGAPLRFRVNNQVAGQIDAAYPGNTFLGHYAGVSLTSGWGNATFGYECGRNITDGEALSAIGYEALWYNTSGYCNAVNGCRAMYANTTGYYNTANGYAALHDNIIGNVNTADGAAALFQTTGDGNTGIGCGSMGGNTVGNGVTGLGYQSNVAANNLGNAMALGVGAIVNASNKTRIGDATMGNTESQTGVFTVSDGRFKTNVKQDDVKGLEFIKLLRPVVYNFDTRKFTEFLTRNMPDSIRSIHMSKDFSASTALRQSGFIAQEVEKAAEQAGYNFSGLHKPETDIDNYSIAYDQIVVPLVKAVQEQQAIIEQQNASHLQQLADLQKQLEEQKQMISNLQKGSATGLNQASGVSDFSMAQNEPNPFSTETVINYNLPEKVMSAYVAVYDLSGKQLATFPISQKGSSSITLSSEKLAAGIYIYSIIADNKTIDSKRMVVAGK